MTFRLASVLTPHDFSEAEMSALVLDGQAYRVGDCISPIDVVPSPRNRAAAIRAVIPPRLIVEQRSAAWVWGALYQSPAHYEVCSDSGSRTRPQEIRRLALREVVIGARDVYTFDGLKVTTPLRTAVDIARVSTDFGPAELDVVARLMRIGKFGAAAGEAEMDTRKNLPNKRVATLRLKRSEERCFSLSGDNSFA